MVRLINPEDWFLVLTVLAGLITFPLLVAGIAMVFRVSLGKIFNKEVLSVFGQLLGIVFFSMLLIQVSIYSDGMGASLIYGRF